MIQATVIQDSVTANGDRITTFEIELPRFILAEFNTHRQLSRNAQSSRAVPVARLIEQVQESPVQPVYWGKNQAGMQADVELDLDTQQQAKQVWLEANRSAQDFAERLHELGVHKQLVNRVLEPFQYTKVVVTATDWHNFFELRTHASAQPEFKHLAELMYQQMQASKPELLLVGEWHVPYVDRYRVESGLVYAVEGREIKVPEALVLSASLVAQVSYRKLDYDPTKARKIWQQLIESDPKHLSPVEHQATPISYSYARLDKPDTWSRGITHASRNHLHSGNFRGWIQHRQVL